MHVVIREHERFDAEDAPVRDREAPAIPRRLFERLRRFDERHARADGGAFTWYAHHAKAGQWVGVVQAGDVQLEVLPKIDDVSSDAQSRRNLLTMLAFSGDVPIRARDIASLTSRSAGLCDALARLFGERLVTELLRGADRAYVSRRENLTRFRGKLAVRAHVIRNAVHRERFVCDFDELVADTPMNRLFRAACRRLLSSARDPATQDSLRRGLLLLDEVDDVVVTRGLLDRVVVTRQNERFAELVELARMIFESEAPTPEVGERATFALLFDMNVVFERFVAGFVRRSVLPLLPGWRLHLHAKGRRRHLFQSDGRGLLRLEPDLLLEGPGGELVVVDTKWKRLSPGRETATMARADLYQLYAYSRRYEAARSVLLYPHVEGLRDRSLRVLTGHPTKSGATVEARYVRMHRELGSRVEHARLAVELAASLVGERPGPLSRGGSEEA